MICLYNLYHLYDILYDLYMLPCVLSEVLIKEDLRAVAFFSTWWWSKSTVFCRFECHSFMPSSSAQNKKKSTINIFQKHKQNKRRTRTINTTLYCIERKREKPTKAQVKYGLPTYNTYFCLYFFLFLVACCRYSRVIYQSRVLVFVLAIKYVAFFWRFLVFLSVVPYRTLRI